ncbi:MAG: hypothetical protein PHR39_03885 [Actinomycetota bacterium]|nr:hypothetical protein [Actinomycetota bacterium]
MKILYIIGSIIAIVAIVKLSLFGQDIRKFLRFMWGDNNSKYKIKEVQIFTIEDLFEDKQLRYPRILPEATFKSAKRKIYRGEQGELL